MKNFFQMRMDQNHANTYSVGRGTACRDGNDPVSSSLLVELVLLRARAPEQLWGLQGGFGTHGWMHPGWG